MRSARRRRRFLAASDLDPAQLGLPGARARELLLTRAWHRAAGETMARRVGVRHGRGGVLILEVRDERWARALREILPSLAARLAAQSPELGIRRFRIDGHAPAAPAVELPPLTPGEADCAPSAEARAAEPDPPRPLGERLEQLARAYLARQKA